MSEKQQMLANAKQRIKDLEAEIIHKAFTEHDFRIKLLRDPKNALSKALGIKLPDELEIHVHEESLYTLHIILPADDGVGTDLSMEELESVAGGGGSDNNSNPPGGDGG